MTSLDDKLIDEVLAFVRLSVIESRNAGKIKAMVGLHGYVTLLHDHLERWFQENDKDRQLDELANLAVDAIVVLILGYPRFRMDLDAVRQNDEEEQRERRGQLEAITKAGKNRPSGNLAYQDDA